MSNKKNFDLELEHFNITFEITDCNERSNMVVSRVYPPIQKRPDHLGSAMFSVAKNKINAEHKEAANQIKEYETACSYVLDDKYLYQKPVVETLKMINEWAELVYPLELGYEDIGCKIKTTAKTRTEIIAQKYRMFSNAKSKALQHIPKNMPFYKFEELMDNLCLNESLTKIVNRLQLESLKEIKGNIANFICRRMFKSEHFFTSKTLQWRSDFSVKQIEGSIKSLLKKEVVLISEYGNYYLNKNVFENKKNRLIYEAPQQIDWEKWVIDNKKECEAKAIVYRIKQTRS